MWGSPVAGANTWWKWVQEGKRREMETVSVDNSVNGYLLLTFFLIVVLIKILENPANSTSFFPTHDCSQELGRWQSVWESGFDCEETVGLASNPWTEYTRTQCGPARKGVEPWSLWLWEQGEYVLCGVCRFQGTKEKERLSQACSFLL